MGRSTSTSRVAREEPEPSHRGIPGWEQPRRGRSAHFQGEGRLVTDAIAEMPAFGKPLDGPSPELGDDERHGGAPVKHDAWDAPGRIFGRRRPLL